MLNSAPQVTNVLIRFIWVWYIPASASYLRTRSFFFALAEMLRRWQWNFFRVETEQVGNTDQYRVSQDLAVRMSWPCGGNDADHTI
jgi:hypothetical protein